MKHEEVDLTGSKILVVDDTPANMDVIRDILEEEEYRVFAAPSGEIGLTLAARIRPDLILLDVMMPGIDGWETCKQLKKDPKTKNIPVIFVSAKTGIEDIAEGFKVGGVDYISKPIRREELMARVFTHLEIIKLFEAQEQLSKQLADKNSALIETQQQLVHAEKMISLGTLTAGIAHEINNPNNFIHVSAQSLNKDIDDLKQLIFGLIDENADKQIIDTLSSRFDPLINHVATIQEGSKRIISIVNDLRSFSQPDTIRRKSVDIGECLQSTINLVHTKFKKVAVFELDIVRDINLYCHPAQLNQVFINLIVNACDAIKVRQLDDTSYRGKIHISCRQNQLATESQVLITVADNGCGMNDNTMKQKFEPFFTTKNIGDGSGLGLSVAYGIAKNHGGDITAISTVNQGSTFTLTLPQISETDG